MEIYDGPLGTPLRRFFTFVVPVLVVVNVPARLLAKPLDGAELAAGRLRPRCHRRQPRSLSRWIFNRALDSYRSASS